jgi:Arc/MetJ family transcription regulator
MPMATNLQIDDRLINKALNLGKHRTKKAAVTQALVEYIHHLEQEKILAWFGTIEYDPKFDYKRQRKRT